MGAGVVIVGSGQAGFQAAASLREGGYDDRIVLVGDDVTLPYQKPPLSKAYLAGTAALETLWFRPLTFYDKRRIELVQGRVVAIEREHRVVLLESGDSFPYDDLVIAVGARARRLRTEGSELDGVYALRTLTDAEQIRERIGRAERAIVIGGGFIGLEFAAIASSLGVGVTVVEALPRLMARAVSRQLSDFFAQQHRAWGSQVLLNTGVAAIRGEKSATGVVTTDGGELAADIVVVGIGIEPNSELAAAAGLAVKNGVVVDAHLRTSDARISAIGDCAAFPQHHTGSRLRLESVQNARDQARHVAARITGAQLPYTSVPWFWSDQRDIKLQIAGITSGRDKTVMRGDQDARSFSAFCFAKGRLLGVESVNRPADHMTARKLLATRTELLDLVTPDLVDQPSFELKTFDQARV